MKFILLAIVKIYQLFISPILLQLFGAHCRYEKTCSEYAREAIEKNGAVKGGYIAFRRLLSCHPFSHRYEYS